jgi:hypothetical protein
VLTLKCVKSENGLDPLLGIKIPATAELSMRLVTPPPALKRIFFIRHGQSEWCEVILIYAVILLHIHMYLPLGETVFFFFKSFF